MHILHLMTEDNKIQAKSSHYLALVGKCLKQDRRAQRELYEILSAKMFPVCLRYMGDREKSKDVLQEGFITLFSKLKEYRGEGSFEGWARRIFVTAALMALRKSDVLSRSEPLEQQGKITARMVIEPKETASLDAETLFELILSMPEGFRIVFNLYAVEGFSHKEIAQMLGLSEGASRSQFSRARGWLQERLKKLNR